MTTNEFKPSRNAVRTGKAWPPLTALLTTLLVGSAHAITIPSVPLQTGANAPKPNLMFILDDSGSMNFVALPADIADENDPKNGNYGVTIGLGVDSVVDRSYLNNKLYYDSAKTYKPWLLSDGTSRMAGGTTLQSVWGDVALAATATNLTGTPQTFFMPKSGVNASTSPNDFFRYQIRQVSGTTRIVKSEYLNSTESTSSVLTSTGLNGTVNTMRSSGTITVPTGASRLEVVTSGASGSSGNADLYLRLGSSPTLFSYDCRSRNSGNTESCVINNPTPGTYFVGLYGTTAFTKVNLTGNLTIVDFREGVTSAGCSTSAGAGWRNCQFATPQYVIPPSTTVLQRTEANEITNYAIWYSYHRTRVKVAKAGASEAFGELGSRYRVGFDSINRTAVDGYALPYTIPVSRNDGQFEGTSRTDWFTILQKIAPSGGTPLRRALQRTGEYYKTSGSDGPYGPENGSNQLSCRQNFAILTTDGFWDPETGYAALGDVDGSAGSEIVSDDGKDKYKYEPVLPYKDGATGFSDTLADVAMYYWRNDLRTGGSGLPNNVPKSGADPAFWQHMVTFGISIGVNGRLNPATDLQSITNGTKSWGNPTDAKDADRADDLWHAAVNGRGSYIVAADTEQFSRGLISAISIVDSRKGSASNVTANSTSIRTDTRVYQASYLSGVWSGELQAFDATSAGVSTTPAWETSKRIPAVASRRVFTWDPTAKAGGGVAAFPTAAQITALDQTSRPGSPVSGTDNAAYIKGDKSKEAQSGTSGKLRNRATLLGDIVNSSPIYVKDNETIFFGANDGFLHAVRAIDHPTAAANPTNVSLKGGAEVLAYMPAGINLSKLATLSDPQYDHEYFVDGPVVVTTRKQTPAKNYLVAALGRGGKGVFGLDVTDPSTFGTTSTAWQLTADSDMGYVLGEPLIVKLNDNKNTIAAIIGNGVNSTTGSAVLFVVNVATGAVIEKIDTGVDGDNGLSAPRGWDNNGDGTVDYVYAGDLKGNLWKFDFTDSTPRIADNGSPFFETPNDQPISAGLALAVDTDGNRWVFFGTGTLLTLDDVTDTDVQTLYGLIDDDDNEVKISELVSRDIPIVSSDKTQRAFEPNKPLPKGKKGWYLDLDNPTDGERVTSRPQVRGGVMVFSSVLPSKVTSCEAAGGTGYINALDPFTGTSLKEPYIDLNNDGTVDDKDKLGGTPGGSIDLGVGMPTLPTIIDELLVVGGSGGDLGKIKVKPRGGEARRLSWREIVID